MFTTCTTKLQPTMHQPSTHYPSGPIKSGCLLVGDVWKESGRRCGDSVRWWEAKLLLSLLASDSSQAWLNHLSGKYCKGASRKVLHARLMTRAQDERKRLHAVLRLDGINKLGVMVAVAGSLHFPWCWRSTQTALSCRAAMMDKYSSLSFTVWVTLNRND